MTEINLIPIRAPHLKVNECDPFKHDKLSRDSEAKLLTTLISTCKAPMTLSVDGEWGTGKTTFLRMWQAHLKKEGYKAVLYFSAWEHDYMEDPLMAFIGEIDEELRRLGIYPNDWKEATKLGGIILRRGLQTGAKLALSTMLQTRPENVSQAISEMAGDITSDALSLYRDTTAAIDRFKQKLERAMDAAKGASSNPRSVVVIVDELDRCKPLFSIMLLECIKHLFDTDNLIFVLGLNSGQLEHSVKSVYGRDFDARQYLRKFIDVDYRLREPKTKEYCKYLCEVFSISTLLSETLTVKHPSALALVSTDALCMLIDTFVQINGIGQNPTTAHDLTISTSARDLEQVFSRLSLVTRIIDPEYYFPVVILFLLLVRKGDSNAYGLLMGNVSMMQNLKPDGKRLSASLPDHSDQWKLWALFSASCRTSYLPSTSSNDYTHSINTLIGACTDQMQLRDPHAAYLMKVAEYAGNRDLTPTKQDYLHIFETIEFSAGLDVF